jgi:hypothetical protein
LHDAAERTTREERASCVRCSSSRSASTCRAKREGDRESLKKA